MINLLRPNQVEEMQADKAALEADLRKDAIQNKGVVRARLRNIDNTLAKYTPPDVTPEKRDKIDKRRQQLEEEIVVGMPSSAEMRRNPPGAVSRHMAWEKKNKRKILEWKNLKLILEKGDPNPDLADIEQLRPTTSYLNMQGAQIPGKVMSFPSEQFKENYDEVNWDRPDEEQEEAV